jgi:hypothetical protein
MDGSIRSINGLSRVTFNPQKNHVELETVDLGQAIGLKRVLAGNGYLYSRMTFFVGREKIFCFLPGRFLP